MSQCFTCVYHVRSILSNADHDFFLVTVLAVASNIITRSFVYRISMGWSGRSFLDYHASCRVCDCRHLYDLSDAPVLQKQVNYRRKAISSAAILDETSWTEFFWNTRVRLLLSQGGLASEFNRMIEL